MPTLTPAMEEKLASIAGTAQNKQQDLFRPIQYLGSKLKIAPTICKLVEDFAQPGSVCDLFAGSGVVAGALSRSRPVVANDIQEYSRILLNGLLIPSGEESFRFSELGIAAKSLFDGNSFSTPFQELIELERGALDQARHGNGELLSDIVENGSLAKFAHSTNHEASHALCAALSRVLKKTPTENEHFKKRYLATYFYGGSYFSYEQALSLDALRNIIYTTETLPPTRETAVAAILSVASHIVNTVGKQFAQPIKLMDRTGAPKRFLIDRTLADRSLDSFQLWNKYIDSYLRHQSQVQFKNDVRREDFVTLLTRSDDRFACIYADPPYTIDHYSRFYHVIETLARNDIPELSTMKRNGHEVVMRGLYRDDRYQSPFCIPSKAECAFSQLFSESSNRSDLLILSYSPFDKTNNDRARLASIDGLMEMGGKHFRETEIITPGNHSHRPLHSNILSSTKNVSAEQLLLFRN